jgi:hypothetical protein
MHDSNARTVQHWPGRVRESTQFRSVTCPGWAQKIAQQISDGAKVRLGQHSTSTSVVEVVLVKRESVRDRDHAEAVAERIVEAIES